MESVEVLVALHEPQQGQKRFRNTRKPTERKFKEHVCSNQVRSADRRSTACSFTVFLRETHVGSLKRLGSSLSVALSRFFIQNQMGSLSVGIKDVFLQRLC